MPTSLLIGSDCVADVQVGHERSSEGYADRWYDQENAAEDFTYTYTYSIDTSVTSDVYFIVQTYAHEIVPTPCTTGTYSASNYNTNYPVTLFQLYNGGTRLEYKYYMDQKHSYMTVDSSTSASYQDYVIYVKYYWATSPAPDFTLKVYSKNNKPIHDVNGNTNEIHMDG